MKNNSLVTIVKLHLWIAFDELYALSLTSFVFRNAQHHFVAHVQKCFGVPLQFLKLGELPRAEPAPMTSRSGGGSSHAGVSPRLKICRST